jgi:UDP-GlcNAc:undecaprenyl-phosphate GlcNAc-1-phosphate transferase
MNKKKKLKHNLPICNPISDTAMAIFRRWVRNLPLTSADRQHIHHILIGLGLNPRQAAVVLYFFTAGLCGIVLLGVAWRNEWLALILGGSGCLAFLIILTSRRDELACLLDDCRQRWMRRRYERDAAKVTWETIQKIDLCVDPASIWDLWLDAAKSLGLTLHRLSCSQLERSLFEFENRVERCVDGSVSDSTASFRLPFGQNLILSFDMWKLSKSPVPFDIAIRSHQRLGETTSRRLALLLEGQFQGSQQSFEAIERRPRDVERLVLDHRQQLAQSHVPSGVTRITPQSVA